MHPDISVVASQRIDGSASCREGAEPGTYTSWIAMNDSTTQESEGVYVVVAVINLEADAKQRLQMLIDELL